MKLTKEELQIEQDLLEGKYQSVADDQLQEIASSILDRQKDAVLNMRINSDDLNKLKLKAKSLNVKYQTFISEILHKVATST